MEYFLVQLLQEGQDHLHPATVEEALVVEEDRPLVLAEEDHQA
jgi:hypothetical protein